jgi:hypothetical protein
MPLVGFTHPQFPAALPLEDAPEAFESAGICPAAFVRAVKDAECDPRRGPGAGISPSICNPAAGCPREVAIRRYLPYTMNPLRMADRLEGIWWHDGISRFTTATQAPELLAPSEQHSAHPKVRRNAATGAYELEFWPGVWVSARMDLANGRLIDYKTQRYAKQDYGFKEEWAFQLNFYRWIWCELGGGDFSELAVWRFYRGCYEAEKAFRRFAAPMLSREALDHALLSYAMELTNALAACEDARLRGGQPEVEAVIRTLPMRGKDMAIFGGKKCTLYCDSKDVCFHLAGEVMF